MASRPSSSSIFSSGTPFRSAVLIGPGPTALTVMPSGPSSRAITRVERLHGGLGSHVGGLAGERQRDRDGGDVDDAPAAAGLHQLGGLPAHEEGAGGVDVEQAIEGAAGGEQHVVHGGRAGAAHHVVETAVRLAHARHEGLHIPFLSHVGDDVLVAVSRQVGLVAGAPDHDVSLCEEVLGDAAPDPGPRSGDHRDRRRAAAGVAHVRRSARRPREGPWRSRPTSRPSGKGSWPGRSPARR